VDGFWLPSFSGAVLGVQMDKVDVLGLELHCSPGQRIAVEYGAARGSAACLLRRSVRFVGACAVPSPGTRRKTSMGPDLLNDPI
jgi:hypothetical protein